jgi:hypothetical protein
MSGFDTSDRAGRGAWAAAVAVMEAAIVLMFSKKKDDVEEVFCVGCRIFGQSGTIAIFFVTLA